MHAEDESLGDLERRLKGWSPAPAPAGPDRDRLLFEVGRASARGESLRRLTPFATAACAFAAIGLGIAWSLEADRRHQLEREVVALRGEANDRTPDMEGPRAPGPALAEAPPSGPADPSSYLALARAFARLDDFDRQRGIGMTDRAGPPEGPDRPILSPLRTRRGDLPIDL